MEVAPQLKDSLNRNFFDLLSTFRQIHGDSVQNQLVLQHVEIPEYLTLYSPAIHWILQCVAYRAPDVRSAHRGGESEAVAVLVSAIMAPARNGRGSPPP